MNSLHSSLQYLIRRTPSCVSIKLCRFIRTSLAFLHRTVSLLNSNVLSCISIQVNFIHKLWILTQGCGFEAFQFAAIRQCGSFSTVRQAHETIYSPLKITTLLKLVEYMLTCTVTNQQASIFDRTFSTILSSAKRLFLISPTKWHWKFVTRP